MNLIFKAYSAVGSRIITDYWGRVVFFLPIQLQNTVTKKGKTKNTLRSFLTGVSLFVERGGDITPGYMIQR